MAKRTIEDYGSEREVAVGKPEVNGKGQDYEFEVYNPSSEPVNPDNDCVDLLVYQGKDEYSGTLITPLYIDKMFRKNKATGECGGGSYFCMPRMVIVRRIDEENIRRTLDALIETEEFNIYFK